MGVMKARALTCFSLLASWTWLLGPQQLLAEGYLSLLTMPEPGVMHVDMEDRDNGSWVLQSSTNLSDWNDMYVYKVFNSAYGMNVSVPDAPAGMFFRSRPYSGDPLPNMSADATLLPAVADNFSQITLPGHLTTPQIQGQDNTPANNPVTDAGATLGRVLFYDKRLSANNSVSCASCHLQEHGFSDPRQFSVGFEGGLTGRNSMGLASAKYYQRENFFWDERAATLEDQVLMPIQDPVEMGMTLPALIVKLSAEDFYAELFTAAFGDSEITATRISRALAQFVRSIVSYQTKFDQGRATNFANFTAQENQGRNIFNGPGRCDNCHGSDNFVPGGFIRNNGLEFPFVDLGLGGVTGNANDNGRFKVPSLRNIELTAPYMHDGRFATLEEVVEFYDSGVVDNPNLPNQLRDNGPRPRPGQPPPAPGPPRRLNLSQQEKDALVAFLKTLTDPAVTNDPKFSDPFRYEPEER